LAPSPALDCSCLEKREMGGEMHVRRYHRARQLVVREAVGQTCDG
jgi:hypothetical protein